MSNLIFLIIGFGAGCYYMWWKFKKGKEDSEELEQEGIITQIDKEGRGVKYTKKNG